MKQNMGVSPGAGGVGGSPACEGQVVSSMSQESTMIITACMQRNAEGTHIALAGVQMIS